MIQFKFFYPFSNFLRVTQEFQEDKAIVKTKSLTFEREFEFDYKEVGEISDAFLITGDQNNFGYWLIAFTGIGLGAYSLVYSNLIILRLLQTMYVCGVILYATSFIKSRYIYFTDKNDSILAKIKKTRHNHHIILKVIETIKNKSEDVQEISTALPFPEAAPAFKHIEYDIPNMKKTTEWFYENEIIGVQKNLSGEYAYKIKYIQLSGKIYRGKIGNEIWCSVLTVFLPLAAVLNGLIFGFGLHLFSFLLYFCYGFAALFVISLVLKFIKRELIGLYDIHGSIKYWTWMNKLNKENIEQIIKFVQSRIPAENKA